MKTVCVIPARHGSQRLPGKPLVNLHGRAMIEWVVLGAKRFPLASEVIVATDHKEIAERAASVGAIPIMTDPDLPSGTDRVYAAIKDRDADIVVNIQGDEPGMATEALMNAHAALIESGADVSTVCIPIHDQKTFESANAVKVVRDKNNRALYFSRSPIPSLYRRDEQEMKQPGYLYGYKHLGLYIYRREALKKFCELPISYLENLEKLEQLRLMENGMSIVCVEGLCDSVAVDTLEDVAKAEAYLKSLED